MGLVLEAACPCGYEGRPSLGGGMSDFGRGCRGPALCTMCAGVVTAELTDEDPLCPQCGGEVIPYDRLADTETGVSSDRYPTFDWNLRDGWSFRLSGADRYLCPRCCEEMMTFKVLICFD